MSKIHVLPDESLGGVLREFVEVNRKADVGDKKVLPDGTILTAVEPYDRGEGKTPGMWFEDNSGNKYPYYNADDLPIIEPTDIVHIDGKRYRMVDRKPNVSEKIIAIDYDIVSDIIVKPGNVLTVKRVDSDGVDCVGGAYFSHGDKFKDEYRVLEPLPEKPEASKSTIDLLTNLALRVTELERKLTEVDNKVEMTLDDIVTLDERTRPLVAFTDVVFKHFASVALEHLRAVKDDG